MDMLLEAIMTAAMLADIKRNATAEEKKEMYDASQESGESCAVCERKGECPIYAALML